MQGKLFASADKGNSWISIATGVTSGLNTATVTDLGEIVVAGNAGVILRSRGDALDFIPEIRSDRQSISALVALPDGNMVTAGEGGVKLISPTSK